MALLNLSGETFHVELSGPEAAPALVLHHALGADHRMWHEVEPRLARSYRVIRFDARGHGASAAPDQVYGMGDFGRDVLAILDRLGVARAHFCGLSLGGMVGLWLALNAPQRLHRLVLANTTAYAGPARAWEGRIREVRSAGTAPIAPQVMESWFTPEFRARASGRVEEVRATVAATSAPGYGGTSCAMRDMDFRPDLARIATPTLVIVSTRDKATPPAWGEAVAKGIPGAQLVRLDTGHMSAIEAPQAFCDTVTGFLARG